MNELRKKLLEELESMGENYYPLHEYPESYEPENVKTRNECANRIIDAVISQLPPEKKDFNEFSTEDMHHTNQTLYEVKAMLDCAKENL